MAPLSTTPDCSNNDRYIEREYASEVALMDNIHNDPKYAPETGSTDKVVMIGSATGGSASVMGGFKQVEDSRSGAILRRFAN